MKLVIGKPDPVDSTPILNLWLEPQGDGGVCLMASGDNGSYYLMSIHKSGKIRCHSCVSDSLGLDLDKDGRLLISP